MKKKRTKKVLDIKKILKTNPQVNNKELTAILRMLENLNREGIRRENYGLEMPFFRGQLHQDEDSDPRAVHLR